jgi:hypothetical protein
MGAEGTPMKFKDSKFIISDEIYNKCVKFANESVSTNARKYANRNQFDVDKIKKDIRNGKIAEEGVYEVVSQLYPYLSKPDHTIYSAKEKSWDPDLKDEAMKYKLAVKSQDIESEINFGRSWVFQFGNGGKFDCDTGIFSKDVDPNHYVSFISLNVPKRFGVIQAIVSVKWLHDKKLFKEMKKQSLRGNKVAVYYEDLEKFKEELWQL